jgi:NIMA-interacting peptidyl-prolyl cis-trans isomerase 1
MPTAPAPAPAAGDGDAAARKRPGAEDAPAAGDGKRRRPENPSSGSRDRHNHQQHHRQKTGHEAGKEGKKERMRASHILIKHEGSRRKASWRDPEGVAISATTRDDAADLARALCDQIVAGELKFEAAATDNSDCNSAKRGGDLGQCPFLPPLPPGQFGAMYVWICFRVWTIWARVWYLVSCWSEFQN